MICMTNGSCMSSTDARSRCLATPPGPLSFLHICFKLHYPAEYTSCTKRQGFTIRADNVIGPRQPGLARHLSGLPGCGHCLQYSFLESLVRVFKTSAINREPSPYPGRLVEL